MRPTASVASPARAGISLFASLLVALVVGVAATSCVPQGTSSPPVLEPTPAGSVAASASPSSVGSTAAGPCAPASLAAQVTDWEGAAGSRIGSVEVRNAGSEPCVVFSLARPQLVDGRGVILIEGAPPGASPTLELSPGGRLRTEVRASNYCGPDPIAPVTVAFVLPEGLGRVVAAPGSPSGLDGVPPCNGPVGSSGTIEMQPWQP